MSRRERVCAVYLTLGEREKRAWQGSDEPPIICDKPRIFLDRQIATW